MKLAYVPAGLLIMFGVIMASPSKSLWIWLIVLGVLCMISVYFTEGDES